MVMAAYNSVNGATMTANAPLLRDVLKGEWAFTGVVVSDWRAARTTAASALAGLDLVMPGPDGPWGDRLVAAVEAGEVPEAEIDDKLTRLLRVARRVGALEPPRGDGRPPGGGAAPEPGDGQAPERLPQAAASGSAGLPGLSSPAGVRSGVAGRSGPAATRRRAIVRPAAQRAGGAAARPTCAAEHRRHRAERDAPADPGRWQCAGARRRRAHAR